MLVKAKWNVKDENGWHRTGEVFETETDLGRAVEVLSAPKKPASAQKPVEEVQAEPVSDTEKQKNRRRR